MRTALLIAAVALASGAGACGPKRPLTEWGYSSWYRKGGGGMMGSFEKQQTQCLLEVGIEDPAAVAPGSPGEARFVQCMNGAGWCTHAWACEKPA